MDTSRIYRIAGKRFARTGKKSGMVQAIVALIGTTTAFVLALAYAGNTPIGVFLVVVGFLCAATVWVEMTIWLTTYGLWFAGVEARLSARYGVPISYIAADAWDIDGKLQKAELVNNERLLVDGVEVPAAAVRGL